MKVKLCPHPCSPLAFFPEEREGEGGREREGGKEGEGEDKERERGKGGR